MNTKSLKKVLISILLFVSIFTLVFGVTYKPKNVSAASDKVIVATKILSLNKKGTYNYYYASSGNMTDFTGFYVADFSAAVGQPIGDNYYVGTHNEVVSRCQYASLMSAGQQRNPEIFMYAEIPANIRKASANGFASVTTFVKVKTLEDQWYSTGEDFSDKVYVSLMQGNPSTEGVYDNNFSATETISWDSNGSRSTAYQDVKFNISNLSSPYLMLKTKAEHYAVKVLGMSAISTTSLCIQMPSFTINSDDSTAPSVTGYSIDANWSGSAKTLTLNVSDTQAGIQYLTCNGEKLSVKSISSDTKTGTFTYTIPENGTYTFTLTDNVGNETTYQYTESKIDKTKPVVTSCDVDSGWARLSKTLTLNVSDVQSGVSTVTYNGSALTSNIASDGKSGAFTYTVTANGSYTFTIIDKVGNSTTYTHTESKFDTTAPVPRITINQYHHVYDIPFTADLTYTESEEFFYYTIDGSTPDNTSTPVTENTVATVSADGDYVLKVIGYDAVGNVGEVREYPIIVDTTLYDVNIFSQDGSISASTSLYRGDEYVVDFVVVEGYVFNKIQVNGTATDYVNGTTLVIQGNTEIEVLLKKIVSLSNVGTYVYNGEVLNLELASSEVEVLPSVFNVKTMADGSECEFKNAQAYTVIYDYEDEDYISNGSFEVEILSKSITVTATAKEKIFGQADPELDFIVEGLIGSDTLSGSLVREVGEDVGEYSILVGTLTSNSNYAMTFIEGTFRINPKTVTVTANVVEKTYGETADPELTYTVDGLIGSDTVSGYLEREEGESVGSYDVLVGTLKVDSSNYVMNFIGEDKFIINKRLIAYTVSSAEKTYGEADPTFEAEIIEGSLANGDSFLAIREIGEDVGTYKIVSVAFYNVFGEDVTDSYTNSDINATFTIHPKTITVQANVGSKIYGEVDNLTYTVEGLVGTDTLSGALVREAGENVGEYNILQGTLANGNYTIVYEGAIYTISPKAIDVYANATAKTYGEVDGEFTYTVDGLLGSDTLSGAPVRAQGEDVGEYDILIGTLNNDNYFITFHGEQAFTIYRRQVVVKANSATKTYGELDPETLETKLLFGTLVNGDVVVVNRVAGENVGTYLINNFVIVNGDRDVSANYILITINGTLKINPKTLTVTANGFEKTYGDIDSELTYTVEGLVGSDTLSGNIVREAGENVGEYNILQGTLANSNYTIIFNGATVKINPKTLTVTANGFEKTYGDIDSELTYTVEGLVDSDTLSGNIVREVGENVGEYNILQGTLANSNYVINFTGAKVIINAKTINVSVDSKEKIYGEYDPEFTCNVSGALAVDTVNVTLAREAGENAGVYAITATISDDNYVLNLVKGGTLTIKKATVDFEVEAKTVIYNGEVQYIDPVASNLPITYEYYLFGAKVDEPINAGVYTVKAIFAGNENYQGVTKETTLTIEKKMVSIVVEAERFNYTGSAIVPEFTVAEDMHAVLMFTDVDMAVDPGSYHFTITAEDENWIVYYEGCLIID
ncbi:MAG: hypothetical protein E7362_02325 [Clostridiales bacterium]|nr:hypothetical protein [Clostridiales bacterium]